MAIQLSIRLYQANTEVGLVVHAKRVEILFRDTTCNVKPAHAWLGPKGLADVLQNYIS